MPFIRVFRANLSNSMKLPYKRLRSRLILAAAYLSRGLVIFARINGPIVMRPRLLMDLALRYVHDEPASSRFTAPGSRTWSQLQLQFQTGAGTTSF